MLIDRKRGYVFVHVYKVAGQSTKLALRSAQLRPLPRSLAAPVAKVLESPQAYSFRSLGAHASAREIRDFLGPDQWDRMFTFTFVRNPWDWQVSLYHFIQHNRINHQRRLVSSMDFPTYIEWRVNDDLHTQSEYICDRHGQVLVDFVGRYERLEDDFAEVARRIGVDVRLPHENATPHRDYRTYYDEQSRKLVADAFADDIDRFGYTFD